MDSLLNIIILNWNGLSDTIECIKSIQKSTYTNYSIVLIDNGSERLEFIRLSDWCRANFDCFILYSKEQALMGGIEENEKELQKAEPDQRFIFIRNDENLGFAGGNNIGLKYLLAKKATFVMILNNDTILKPDSLGELMLFMNSNPEFVAVTPQIRYLNPSDMVWNCGGKLTWFGNRNYYFAGKNISSVPQSGHRPITFITGCAMLFKPEITGILTEIFFFGEEDLDFSFRQKKCGNKMACCYSSVIMHKVNASAVKLNKNILGGVYIHYLSRLINNRQYSSKFMLIVKIILNIGYGVPMILIRYKIGPKRSFFMFLKILTELRKIDKIDKEYTLQYLKEDFSHLVY
jgi:GT2 family glycosyltransferase